MLDTKRESYLTAWNMYIVGMHRLVADHAAGLNQATFEQYSSELYVYAKVAYDVAIANGTEPQYPPKG